MAVPAFAQEEQHIERDEPTFTQEEAIDNSGDLDGDIESLIAAPKPELDDDIYYNPFVKQENPFSSQANPLATKAEPKSGEYRFKLRQLALPGALIAVGAAGVSMHFHNIKNSLRDEVAKWRGGHYLRFDDHIQYLPFVGYLGLGLVGVPCKHRFLERFVVGATAYMALGVMVNGIKYSVKEPRPDSGARNSFPSGHTATVFMGAELIRLEYGTGIAIGAYTIAVGVGFLRIYNDRHWLNDVLAGAGIGILSARIGYWMLPLYQKWFHWDKKKAVALMPSYDPATRTPSIGLMATF